MRPALCLGLKYEGDFGGTPFYSSPAITEDTIYFINSRYIQPGKMKEDKYCDLSLFNWPTAIDKTVDEYAQKDHAVKRIMITGPDIYALTWHEDQSRILAGLQRQGINPLNLLKTSSGLLCEQDPEAGFYLLHEAINYDPNSPPAGTIQANRTEPTKGLPPVNPE